MDFLILVWDPDILFWIHQHIVNSTLTPGMILISNLANRGGIWIAIGIVLCFHKTYRNTGAAVLLSICMVILVGDGLLKHLVMRLRPCIEYPWVPMAIHTPSPHDYSFPSGHSFVSFASATVLWKRNKRWGMGAGVFALCVAFSRLYLFMHYPSDVVAGAFLGIGIGTGSIFLVDCIHKKRRNHFETANAVKNKSNICEK